MIINFGEAVILVQLKRIYVYVYVRVCATAVSKYLQEQRDTEAFEISSVCYDSLHDARIRFLNT